MSTKRHQRLDEVDNPDFQQAEISCCGYILIACSILLLACTFPFSLCFCLKVVQEFERAVIFRLGRIRSSRAQGPGLFFILPCVDNFVKVDLRTFTFNIAPQEILTKDSVTVVVDAVIYARIHNATMSVVNVADARGSTYLLGATTLRTVLGTAVLSDLLADRERLDGIMKILTKDSVTVVVDAVIYARIHNATMSVVNVADARGSTYLLGATTLRTVLGTAVLSDLLADRERLDGIMKTQLDLATENWGVQVERVEIKDVRLPVQMQRAMAAEAESTREARAKVIAAQGEMNAARNLKEAADVMSESPTTLQLRYLQTLHSVAEEKNSTIIFPLPMNFPGFSKTLGSSNGVESTGF